MKVLVVGAGGQVGRDLIEGGREFPELEIVGVDRQQLDITDGEAVERAYDQVNPAIVINAAAYTAVDKAETDVVAATQVNAHGPRVLADAAVERSIPVLHISTDYVFSGRESPPSQYREQDAVGPTGTYGETKLLGEVALREALPQHLILRVSWVFGRYGHNFVKTMVRLARERAELRIVADQHGRPTPARAIARALLDLADRYRRDGSLVWGTYHFAGDPPTTWHAFAEEIIAIARTRTDLAVKSVVPITTAEFPTPAERPKNSVLDCTLYRDWIGGELPDWRPALPEVVDAALTELAG